jgi:hypothetical protein
MLLQLCVLFLTSVPLLLFPFFLLLCSYLLPSLLSALSVSFLFERVSIVALSSCYCQHVTQCTVLTIDLCPLLGVNDISGDIIIVDRYHARSQ